MPYVPGNAVEGFCSTCKKDTLQTVLEVEGLQIRLVRCEKCKEEASFLMAREKTKAALREVAAKRRSTATPVRRKRRKPEDPGQTFRKLIEGKDLSAALDYNIRLELDIGQVIRHPTFGIGVVVAVNEPMKANITFEDGPRMMVCNKK